jgi:hypothetical protein
MTKEKEKQSQPIKHDSLWIPGPSILANILPSKSLLHDKPPRLIKPNTPTLHDGPHPRLTRIIQPLSRIAALDILSQVKVCTAEPCFRIIFETGLTEANVGVLGKGIQALEGLR